MEREWPAMDSERGDGAAAGRRLGSGSAGRSSACARGGATTPATSPTRSRSPSTGSGPRGGGAHTPEEFVLRDALRQRAEVALAIARAALATRRRRRDQRRRRCQPSGVSLLTAARKIPWMRRARTAHGILLT